MNTILPHKVIDCERKLPSDSGFRKDLISWRKEDEVKGQIFKE